MSHALDLQGNVGGAHGAARLSVTLDPNNAQFLFNRASVRRFVRQLAGAERNLDRVIALQTADYEAYKSCEDLPTQTTEWNRRYPFLSSIGL